MMVLIQGDRKPHVPRLACHAVPVELHKQQRQLKLSKSSHDTPKRARTHLCDPVFVFYTQHLPVACLARGLEAGHDDS